MLQTIQDSLSTRALEFREAHTFDPKNYVEFQEVVKQGWAFSWWCGDSECEAK
jgi:hypothetical protein